MHQRAIQCDRSAKDSSMPVSTEQPLDNNIQAKVPTAIATNTTPVEEKSCSQKRSGRHSPTMNADIQSPDSNKENGNVPKSVENSTENREALRPDLDAAEQPEKDECKSQTKANRSRNVNRSELILFQPCQTIHLHFPIGCDVWWGLQLDKEGETFNQGTIHSVYFSFSSRDMVYEVQPNDKAERIMLYEEDIVYAPGSLVYYSSSKLPDDEANRTAGEVLYCSTTTSSNNVNKVKELAKLLQNEQKHLKANNADVECSKRIRAILLKLDTGVFIDRLILQQTGVVRSVKSLSKLLTNPNDEGAELAANLIEKWRSQIAHPQFYYTLLTYGQNGENQLVEDVTPSHIKLRT